MHLQTLVGPAGYLNLTQCPVYIAIASYLDYILALAVAQLASYLGIYIIYINFSPPTPPKQSMCFIDSSSKFSLLV